tara:strand:- start:1740 stop:2429 length:690 start_codon:yes stop_codon:yes gene_type:complete
MSQQKIVLIGAKSDLISPFKVKAISCGYELISITREEWDLKEINIPNELLQRICDFEPNHVLYAAGLNRITNFKETKTKLLLETVTEHFNVNCLTFLSLITTLKDYLDYDLTSIHAISSLYGIYGRATRLPYSISKHALEGTLKCLALEMPNTLVLGYRPGFFKTKLTDKNLSENAQKKITDKIPANRFGEPEELSNIIIHNITKPPLYCTGSCITLDGGLTAGGIFTN